jgi:hypothetical protein
MWKISASTLHRASLSNPFAYDVARFCYERSTTSIDPTFKSPTIPRGPQSVDYLDLVSQQHTIPYNPVWKPGE